MPNTYFSACRKYTGRITALVKRGVYLLNDIKTTSQEKCQSHQKASRVLCSTHLLQTQMKNSLRLEHQNKAKVQLER